MIASMMRLPAREFFLKGLGISFGVWLFYLGLNKWLGGPAGFIEYIAAQFAETWVPPLMATILGWIIIALEPVLGVLLIIGWKARFVWLATTKLMFMLMFGQAILGKYDVMANNWLYLVIALGAAALSEPKEK